MAGNDQQDQHAQIPGGTDDQGTQPAAPAPAITDPDDLELHEAKAAVEAEEAGGAAQPGGEGKPAAPAQPEQPGAQQGQQPTDGGDKNTPMIPKPRFDEVLSKNDDLARQNAFLAGQVEALKGRQTPQQPATQAAPPQKSADERLQEIRNEMRTIAKNFDAGDITAEKWEEERQRLSDAEFAIREEQALAKIQPKQQPAQSGDPLYLDRLTADLEEKHPYLAEITSKQDFTWLTNKAREQLESENVSLKGDMGTYRLRERVAALSDQYGEMLTGKKLTPPGNGQQPPSNGAQPPLSQEAKARADKLRLQNDLPPNVSGMTGATPGGDVTEQAVENMTDDEIAALPTAARHRLLGITP